MEETTNFPLLTVKLPYGQQNDCHMNMQQIYGIPKHLVTWQQIAHCRPRDQIVNKNKFNPSY